MLLGLPQSAHSGLEASQKALWVVKAPLALGTQHVIVDDAAEQKVSRLSAAHGVHSVEANLFRCTGRKPAGQLVVFAAARQPTGLLSELSPTSARFLPSARPAASTTRATSVKPLKYILATNRSDCCSIDCERLRASIAAAAARESGLRASWPGRETFEPLAESHSQQHALR